MREPRNTVILFDVDDTLLDNDRFGADLGSRLCEAFGAEERDRYWSIFTKLRNEIGRADYLASLQLFRAGLDDRPELLHMAEFMLEYPFSSRLYPAALDAVRHLRSFGLTAVLSDGDIVFQPRKIRRAGIWNAVEGRVLIAVHKEREFGLVEQRYPAEHYVMVDDKPNLLAALKSRLGERLTTVLVRQGHYANSPAAAAATPPPDRIVEGIGDLVQWRSADLEGAFQ